MNNQIALRESERTIRDDNKVVFPMNISIGWIRRLQHEGFVARNESFGDPSQKGRITWNGT